MSGLLSQVMIKDESTYGTRVVPTKGITLVSETFDRNETRLLSASIRSGWLMRHSSQWAVGGRRPGGALNLELRTLGQGLLWKAALGGTPGTTGVGPYVHTYSPALPLPSLTIQIGRPSADRTVNPFDYLGAKVDSWELGCAIGEIPHFNLEFLAQDEKTDQTLATITYPSGDLPMTYVQGAFTIAGSSFDIRSITINGNNNLAGDEESINGAGKRREPLQNDLRSYTFTLDSRYEANTAYARITAGTEAAMSLTFTAGAQITQVTGNVRFDSETPKVAGPELLSQPLTGEFIGSTTDASGISVIRTTSEATADA
jgi:Phage tail tube protein